MSNINVATIREQGNPVAPGLPGGPALQTASLPSDLGRAEATPVAPKDDEKIWNNGEAVIKLTRPLTIHGDNGPEETRVLILKEPLYEVQCRLGDPVRQIFYEAKKGEKNSQEAIVNHDVVMAYIAEMSGHDKGILSQLSIPDGRKCTEAIAALFQGEAGE
jgi:hypothetical protein